MNFFWRRGRNKERDSSADTFGTLFVHFRRIVTTNNKILEKIADLERVLGGEYVYDRTFLQNAVSEIIDRGRKVIYHLNAMSGDQYSLLYDRFTATADHLTDILAGGPGPYGPLLVLDWDILHRDLGHLAGNKGASLGEATNALGLPVPAGFVVSTTGYRKFMEANNLFDSINQVLRETNDQALQAERIAELFAGSKIPHELTSTINKTLKKIASAPGKPDRFAVRSSGVEEDGARSFAGQFRSYINIPANGVMDACKKVMASRFSEHICHYLGNDVSAEKAPMAVLVQPMVSAMASGVLYTRDPNNPAAETMVLSAVVGFGEELALGRDSGDRFIFDRNYPFLLRESHIGFRSEALNTNDQNSLARTSKGMRRGSGIVGLEVIRQMAEYGILLEKRFEYPQDIEWCLDGQGQLWILQSRPLHLQRIKEDSPRTIAQLSRELASLPILMEGKGHICQVGLAGGQVVHVNEDSMIETFPVGAVAVSHFASPRLAGIVQRASALITDIGSPTSHLATIAREYRTPALFGTREATSLLHDGTQVMIDVEAQTVYEGRVELPADINQIEEFEQLFFNQEASLLRRLLRLLAPLNLADASSPFFKMKNCQTIHDFLRFCHEKAVAELIEFHTSGKMIASGNAPILNTDLPIRLRILDIGGGLKKTEAKEVAVQDVSCRPFLYLLNGLMDKDFWTKEPVSFGMRDLLSSITNPPNYSGENLAIISDVYCNLSLRLGYHFNIIDCYLSDESDDNYVYFRFVGGFAEAYKRQRRADMISQVLTGLHFKVERKGDLVLGKVKMLERDHMESILVHLGELVAFTRQLDVKMADDQSVERFFSDFLGRIGNASPTGGE